MTALSAPGFAEQQVRDRARRGAAAAFPPVEQYGETVYGAPQPGTGGDQLDEFRMVPPVFVPRRLDKLLELGMEPLPAHVSLRRRVGGFESALPVYVSAFGSTKVAGSDLGLLVAQQAARAGIPLVVGENVGSVNGYGRLGEAGPAGLLSRIRAYSSAEPAAPPDGEPEPNRGGVVVQQSVEDADAEVWNLVYSDPAATGLLDSGRLAFELKVGQGAKPGLGGLTVLSRADASRLSGQFSFEDLYGAGQDRVLRCGTPGTYTEQILRQQIRLMRNNFPRCRIWVKLPPARDVSQAARIAWTAGADAVTVDGAEAGSGWAPTAFLGSVGLPLAHCLHRIGAPAGDLLASGRMWSGVRAAKTLALGATAIGLGRAALLAVDEDPANGLGNLLDCLAFELRLIVSAMGKYDVAELSAEDLLLPETWSRPGTGADPWPIEGGREVQPADR